MDHSFYLFKVKNTSFASFSLTIVKKCRLFIYLRTEHSLLLHILSTVLINTLSNYPAHRMIISMISTTATSHSKCVWNSLLLSPVRLQLLHMQLNNLQALWRTVQWTISTSMRIMRLWMLYYKMNLSTLVKHEMCWPNCSQPRMLMIRLLVWPNLGTIVVDQVSLLEISHWQNIVILNGISIWMFL